MNLGALGMILGHELTHGFNEMGQHFDMHGNQSIWISQESHDGFRKMAQCVDGQYGNFCYQIGNQSVCLHPNETEDENLSDNSGIKAAYRAYMASRPESEPPLPGLEDLSMDQIFFLSFAQPFCETWSDEELLKHVDEDGHSPGRNRITGTLQNFPPFAEAWKCKKGDYMYPKHSCKVW